MHCYPIPNLRMLPPSPPTRPPFLQYANNSLGVPPVNNSQWGPRNSSIPLRPPTPRRNNIVLTSCEPDSPDNTKSDLIYNNVFSANQFPIVPATPGYNYESNAGFCSAPVPQAPSSSIPTQFSTAAQMRNDRCEYRSAPRSSATSSTMPTIDTSAPPPVPPPPVSAPPVADTPFANLSPLIGDEETYLELLQDFTSQTNLRSPFRLFGSLPSVPPTTTIPTPGATPALSFESMLDVSSIGTLEQLHDSAMYCLEASTSTSMSTSSAAASLGDGINPTGAVNVSETAAATSRGALLRACITRDSSPESLLRVAQASGQPQIANTATAVCCVLIDN